jgi:starvation-inducible DNA-binding protein
MPKHSNQDVVAALGVLLADSYILSLKTQNYHWNVVGSDFVQLHQHFGAQYDALSGAIDEIAERIRALGSPAPASFAEFTDRASVKSTAGHPAARDMITTLRDDHLTAAKAAYAVIKAANAAGDDSSADLATSRVTEHEKAAWMLSALLG